MGSDADERKKMPAAGRNSFRTVSYFTLVFGGVRDIRACKRLGVGPGRPSTPTETIMFTKTLLAALILATASIAVTSKVNAGPLGQQSENAYFDRASKVTDGGN